MKSAITWGLILAAIVTVINLAFGAMTLVSQGAQYLFLALVVPLTIVLVFLCLNSTKSQSGIGGQLLNTVVFTIVGAVGVFIGAFLTHMIFPGYLEAARTEAFAQMEMDMANETEEVRQAATAVVETMMTPFVSALMGFAGTTFFSLLFGGIFSIFLRKKD